MISLNISTITLFTVCILLLTLFYLNFLDYSYSIYDNHAGSITYFDKALKIKSDDEKALNNKGVDLDDLGNHTGDITHYDSLEDKTR